MGGACERGLTGVVWKTPHINTQCLMTEIPKSAFLNNFKGFRNHLQPGGLVGPKSSPKLIRRHFLI